MTFLAILDYVLFPEKESYLCHHYMLDTNSYERDLRDFSFSFLELPKFRKTKDQLVSPVEKWAYFFKAAPDTTLSDLDKIVGSDVIIKRAYQELDRYNWSRDELIAYDRVDLKRQENENRLEKAKKEGKERGIRKSC